MSAVGAQVAQPTGVIEVVVAQHVEETVHLSGMRRSEVSAPHIDLHHLGRFDERIEAHLDGVIVAGEHGWRLCEAAFESVNTGVLFTATAAAIQAGSAERLNRVFAVAEAVPEARSGFLSAFGWVSAQYLQKIGTALLSSANAFRRYTGVAACSLHRIDPGVLLVHALKTPDGLVRARALRAAGELGRRDLLSHCVASVQDSDPACSFWAAWSAVLLGDRGQALEKLVSVCRTPGPFAARALSTVLLAMELPQAHDLLSEFAHDPAHARTLVQGCGFAGDPQYVSWLIEQMENERLARLAGESVSMITGLDIELFDLDREPPEVVDTEPNDNPEDSRVERDPDEDLPWPDPRKLADWWRANEPRFSNGVRTFMGGQVTPDTCVHALRVGYQRQRRTAAMLLALQRPGAALFEWRAPAWRQQRKLASHA